MEGQLSYLLEHAQMLLSEHSSSSRPMTTTSTLAPTYSYVNMQAEVRRLEFWRAIIAECLAAFFYVLIVLSVATASTEHLLQTNCAVAAGLIVAVLMASVGRTCHVNPVVTAALLTARHVSPLRAVLYVCAQCGGGVAGAALVLGVHGRINDPVLKASYPSFGMELVLAFLIAYAVCGAHNNKICNNRNSLGNNFNHVARPWHSLDALVIGAAHTAGLVAWKGSLNPARALGSAFVSKAPDRFDKHWVFWAGPMLGAVAGALAYEFVFNGRQRRNDKFDNVLGGANVYGRVGAKTAPGLPGPGLPGPPLPGQGLPGSNLPGYGPTGYLESGSEEDMLDDLERAKAYKSGLMHEMGDYRYASRGGNRYEIYSGSKSLYGGDGRSALMYDSRSAYEATPGQLRRSRSIHTKPGMNMARGSGSRRNPYDFLPEEPKEHMLIKGRNFNEPSNSPNVDFDYNTRIKEYSDYGSKRGPYYNEETLYGGNRGGANFNYNSNFNQTSNGPSSNVANVAVTTAANNNSAVSVGGGVANAYNSSGRPNDNF